MLERLRCPNCSARFSADADRRFLDSAKLDCPKCKLSSTLAQYRLFAEPVEQSAQSRETSVEKTQRRTEFNRVPTESTEFKWDPDTLKGCGCMSFSLWILGYYVLFQYGCVGPSLEERERTRVEAETRQKLEVEQKERKLKQVSR